MAAEAENGEAKVVKCPKCNYENEEGAAACNLCGEILFSKEPGGRGMTMRVGGYRTPEKKSYSGLITIGLLVLLIVIVVLMLRLL